MGSYFRSLLSLGMTQIYRQISAPWLSWWYSYHSNNAAPGSVCHNSCCVCFCGAPRAGPPPQHWAVWTRPHYWSRRWCSGAGCWPGAPGGTATGWCWTPCLKRHTKTEMIKTVNTVVCWWKKGRQVPCLNIDGIVQEKRNSSALALELHLSCTNPSI